MFEILTNLLAGGAWAANDAHTREDSGGHHTHHGSLIHAENGLDCLQHGEHNSAAWHFGRAGETEGQHNSRWHGWW